ncbi:hypothetical protein PNEG_02350 [Pneumocystis murina B123]|uniref:Sfi1 spindle body domain-containing protein n=1 Tax=Pneumocystis murina (strain B123) TaxID=1069680 RepID=M7P6B6_PNEMU|nr:hypothetical protein PNEG_02350 [Pneumocystis murina B123]EMR09405.2 hypothetical protein PNEG_02350 [Pneumocystis murina B123]
MHKFTADLNLLYEIVVVADTSKQRGSFLAIFEAYDTVLKRKNIDSTNDRVYYKYILKLVQIQGEGWEYKFKSLIKNMGIDFRSIKKTTPENSILDHKNRDTDHTFTPNYEESSKSLKDFFYSSDETSNSSLASQITKSSPVTTKSLQKENVKISTYNNNIVKNAKHAEYIYNERCILIKQKYFKIWVRRTEDIFNYFQSMYSKAILHDSYILSFQALKIWHQKSLYLKKTKRNAENAGNYVLMEKSFIKWLKMLYIKKKKHQQLYNFILMKIFLNAWRKIWIMQYKIAALHLLSFPFSIWKKKLLIQKNIMYKAIEWQRQHLLKHIFISWFTKTYLDKLILNKSSKKKYDTFLLWKSQLQLIYTKNETAIKNYSKKIINYYYKLWFQKSKKIYKNMIKAIALSNNMNIIKIFHTWDIKYKIEISKKEFLSFKNKSLCKKYFLNWKKKTENMQLASNFFNYTLLRLTFINWRQVLYLNILLIKLENKLRRRIIYKWILKERLILLLRVRGRRLYYLTFYLWKKYFRTLDDRNILLISILKNKIDRRIKIVTFLEWIEKLTLLNKNKKNAKGIYSANIKRNIINIWRKKNINIQENNLTAKYKSNYFYTKHSILHWKGKFHKRIKSREQHVNLFIYNHNLKLCHRTIMHWQYYFKSIILNYDIALKFRASKYQCLIIQFFSIWTNKYKNLDIILIQTRKEKNLKNIKLYFIKWKKKQNIILSMSNNALVILIKKNHTLIKKYIRKWELHILQLRGPEIQAHLFKKKQNELFMKKTFYFWKHQLKKKNVPEKESTKNDNFSLFGNSSNIISYNNFALSPFLNKLRFTKL